MKDFFHGYDITADALRQVQEQLDYEYFVKSYQTDERTWQNVTLKETVTPVNSHWKLGSLKMGDCKPYFCVSVPGQSEWLQADPVQSMIQAAAGSELSHSKRPREDHDVQAQRTQDKSMNISGNCSNSKHQCLSTAQTAQADALERINAPVLLYAEDVELRLHDMVEVVGVYQYVPEVVALEFGGMTLDEVEKLTGQPPTFQPVPYLAATLHAITVKTVTPFRLSRTTPSLGNDELQGRAQQLRAQAIDVLAAPLGGDTLAAEYLLLQLVSRIHHRVPSQALGVLSLNLITPAKDATPPTTAKGPDSADAGAAPEAATAASHAFGAHLSPLGAAMKAAIASLVPACVALPLTVTMLAPRTQLLLDETDMQQGQLTDVGCKNVIALGTLMASQVLDCDFGAYSLPMPVDAPVTVLSVGASLLKPSVDLELLINAAGTSPQSTGVGEESLPAIRAYLHQVQHLDFDMGKANSAWLEQDFIDARRQDQSVTASDFHKQLTLARLISVSRAETQMTKVRWHQMKAMEHARLSRLKAARPNHNVARVDKIVSAKCG
ncbi:MAG: E2F target 1 [Trebouxia sp. A1-2]|nr:MAG: E2F target 1 [Trebouxia sp. A1-2]